MLEEDVAIPKSDTHASRTWHQLIDLDQIHERRVLMDFEMSAPVHGPQPPRLALVAPDTPSLNTPVRGHTAGEL